MTLTELSYYSRKLMPFIIFFFLVFLIFFYSIKLFLLYLNLNKPQVIYTNPVFGKIKKPEIKEASKSAGLNFVLDNIEGQPITATESAKVYFLPSSTTKFGYREKIYLIAKNLDFDTEKIKHRLEGNEAIFSDEKKNLSIDITNFNFTYRYQFEKEEGIFQDTIIPGKEEIENKARDFFKGVGRYPEELFLGNSNLIYLNFNPALKTISVVEKPQEANLIEIDFYRPDISEAVMVSPNFFNSQNYLVMVFHQEGFKILRAQIRFFEKSEEQVGIYPLKTGDEAWGELKGGEGLVINIKEGQKDIIIKKMFLGYLDPDFYQEYLQPVYVFLGENNFVAYVPAIANQYLSD
ncbi:MAG: hypothetical protein N2482_03665 [Patescibacteria group bacterium]|nr:hypothetical protein [Patescibacteria group bacterium]